MGENAYETSVIINSETGEMLENVQGAIEHQTRRALQVTEQLKKVQI